MLSKKTPAKLQALRKNRVVYFVFINFHERLPIFGGGRFVNQTGYIQNFPNKITPYARTFNMADEFFLPLTPASPPRRTSRTCRTTPPTPFCPDCGWMPGFATGASEGVYSRYMTERATEQGPAAAVRRAKKKR